MLRARECAARCLRIRIVLSLGPYQLGRNSTCARGFRTIANFVQQAYSIQVTRAEPPLL